MCNTVLLSRVAQYYHPYYSMSAVCSPNSKSCPDTTNHQEQVKVLRKQETVQRLHCFKNAQYYDVEMNKPKSRNNSGNRNTRIDTRFPVGFSTVSIQAGLTTLPTVSATSFGFSTIGCSSWPITKAVTPTAISELSSMNLSNSVSREDRISLQV